MNVYISLSSDKYLDKYLNLVKSFSGTNLNFKIFIDQIHKFDIKKYSNIVHTVDHFFSNELTIEEAYNILLKHNKIINSNLYTSDLRFQSKILHKNNIIIKQALLTKLIIDEIKNDNSISFNFIQSFKTARILFI